MSDLPAPLLRTIAFGDLQTGLWGTAWVPDPREPGLLGLGRGQDTTTLPATLESGLAGGLEGGLDGGLGEALEGAEAREEWRLVGDHAELIVSPAGEAVGSGEQGTTAGFDQICRISGRVVLAGTEQQLDCQGHRGAHAAVLDPSRLDSLREVSAWFEPAEGFSLLALRERGSEGNEGDLVTAAVHGHEASAQVADPRLSTTYARDGRPLRVGLELWVGDGDTAEEAVAQEQYPRRAAGQAVGSEIRTSAGALELQAELLTWHSESREGAGVYLLARAR